MASLIKIKRSNVAAKRPTTSDIAAGELALNTKDKRAFSSDGGAVFEIGANVHSLTVGSGTFSIGNGAITFPTSDGSVGQVLSTDGSGTLSFSSISSSSASYKLITSDYTANTGDKLSVGTSGSVVTVTLPSSPSEGNIVEFIDKDLYWSTNALTIARNGSTIEGSADDLVTDVSGANFYCQYDGSTWQVFGIGGVVDSASLADGAVTRSKVTSDIVANTYLQPLIANTNTWITAVETREAAHTANTLLHLANTNSYIATKVSTSTFNSALANTNSYIAYVAANAGEVSNAYLSSTYTTNTVFQSALANTNSYIATKVSTSTFNSALANTNSYIASVQSDVDANEATERAALANTNSYIATKVSTSTFNSALANTNSYIATVQSDVDSNEATERAALANTNSYIATKVSTSTFNSALANTNSYIASVQSDVDSNEATERAALANTNSYIATKANIASPTFTGVPAAPTASAGTNTTQIATTAFVRTEVTNLIDSAPTTLDTLNELAAALGDDPNFATTIASTYQTKSVERAALANTNSYIATKVSTSTFNSALANTNSYIATKLSSSSYTAADVLSKLLTVDGAGTGLDADTLDGVQGASYLRSDASDTYTGQLDITSGQNIRFGHANQTDGNDGKIGAGLFTSGLNIVGTQTVAAAGRRISIYGTIYDGSTSDKYWHAGNDGAGSGLDADTVDGIQGASFLRSDAADTATGNLTVSGLALSNEDLYLSNYAIISNDSNGAFADRTGSNIDHFYHNDSTNTWHFCSDTTYKATGNANIQCGGLSATTKSFVIDHPTKEGMKLRYGSLEGPENGVYVRGRLKDNNVIELPDYWTGLVDEDTITVNLTAIGKSQNLYVADIKDNKVYVKGSRQINCFYTVFGERKDVDKLEVEYESE